MIFVDQMKNLKIYKKPMLLPTLEADKKKHSAIFLLTPNYESSKKLMNHPMIINRKRFESYYLEQDLSYYITGKVSKKVIKEDYIREYNIEDIYHNLCEMTAKERNRLKDNQFGIPSKRKYPLNDEQHVRSAIKFFNYVDKEDEEELANNIIKAINKFNMKVNVGENNRFSKYYQAPVNESAKIKKSYGIYCDNNGSKVYNSIVEVEGYKEKMRGRSELLIIKGDSIYLSKDKQGLCSNEKGLPYDIPGGSWDPKESHEKAALREAQEEARITAKNIKYIDNYIVTYPEPKQWVQNKIPKKDWWYGYYTEVFIGEYDSLFKGHIDDVDKDEIINTGKFYKIKEVWNMLNSIHQKAILEYTGKSFIAESYEWNNNRTDTTEPKEFNAIYISYNKNEKCVDEDLCCKNIWYAMKNFVQMHNYEDHKPAYVSVLDKNNTSHIIGIIDIVNKGEELSWKWIETYNIDNNYTSFNESSKNNISFGCNFADVLKIVNSLSNKELNYICNGDFKNSPYVIYREVLYLDNYPAAFIDVYQLPNMEKNSATIVIAVDNNYRSNGYAQLLCNRMIKSISNKGITKLYWNVKPGNIQSVKLAEKLGFSKKEKNEYLYSLNESVDMINTPENPIETAYAIITNHKGEILVQYNTSVNGYHLPGGHVKSGEKLHEGLYRECKEELGIELIEEVKDMEFLYTVEDTYNRGSIFTILNYRGEIQNLEPKYCSDLLWISRDELFNGNITCSEPLKQYLYKWNQKIEEESINNTTVLSNFIKFSGYSTDVVELSKIMTSDVYYRLLKVDLKLPISSIKDIPIISYEITSRDHGFTSDITSDGNPIIYIKVTPYDNIGSIENYAKDIIRITAISILSSIYPESKDTYLSDILVDDLLGINTIRREYAKYLFTEITIEDYHSVLKSGDIMYIMNLLSKKYPDIRRDDLIKSDVSYDYKSEYTNECSIDLSSIYNNIETSYVSESAIEVENSSYFNEDALSGMDYLKFGDYYTFFDESAANDSQLKLLLYNERIRQRSDLLLLLKKVKEENPVIKYTYPDLEKYLSRNAFLDLYFYNELFFKNNIWKMNKGFNLYLDLLSRLINDPRISKNGYTKKTIFIPVLDWYKDKSTKMWLYREDINPVSIIYELMRTESSSKLKSLFGNIDLVFFSKTTIFKMNFSQIDDKDIKRLSNTFKMFINKICNQEEFNADDIDTSFDNTESSREIKANLIDKIEDAKGVDLTGKSEIISNRKKELENKSKKSDVNAFRTNKKDQESLASKALEKDEKDMNLTQSVDKDELKKTELDSLKIADTIDQISSVASDTEDALDKLDTDIDFKALLADLGSLKDEGVKIDTTRAARMNELDKKFLDKNIKGKTIRELLDEKEDNRPLEISNIKVSSPNKEWNNMTYMNFDKDYDLQKDILACFYHFTKTSKPIAIRTVNIEDDSTSEDRLDLYTVEMEDFRGTRFTVKLDIPRMKDNRMYLRGNSKTIETQFFNMPIIKTAADACQIVSNYRKIFIYRVNTVSGRSNPTAGKILRSIKKYEGKKIKFTYGDNTRICNKYELPVDYMDLASVLSKIETDTYIVYFNQDELRQEYPNIDDSYGVPYGINKKDNTILYYTMEGELFSDRLLYSILSEDEQFAKSVQSHKVMRGGTYSRCNVMNSKIPLAVICGYCEGLSSTLKKANVPYELKEKLPAEYKDPSSGYDYLKFKDGYLIFRISYESLMLLNGLRDSDLSEFSMMEIDNKAMYIELLDNYGGRSLSDGLDNFYDCLVDPITKEVLEYYQLPLDFVSILLYGNLLLCDNKFIKHTNTSSRRVRRTELIAAYTYEVLSEAYGNYANMIKHNKSGATISVKRTAVIDKILSSPISSDDSVINALNAIETTNAITFKGKAGLNSDRSYSLDKRTYDDSMLNVLGMSTNFSGNVGITRQATMDMNIESARGYIKPINSDISKLNAAKSLCATEAVTPFGTTRDDAPRTYMTFVQTSKHSVRTEESDPLLITNGADEAIPYMTLDKFAFKAKSDGVIKEITSDYIIVEYNDKTKDYINLKETVEKNSDGGYYVPLKLDKYPGLKVGSKITRDQILAYDPESFSNSVGESDNIAYNIGKLVKVAVINSDEGFEDSGMCTERLSKEMNTRVIEKQEHTIDKDANVFYMAKVGDHVEVEDSLIIWQDPHDEEQANTLLRIMGHDQEAVSELGRKTIKSELSGTIADIKIYRTVEIEELSPSLQKIVNEYERPIKELKAKLDSEGISSKDLPATYKLEPTGKLKKAEEAVYIEFYLEYKDTVAVGDKLVYFSANKAVIKNIIPEENYPYTDFRPNEPIDAFVSEVSISKRIVTSSVIDGSINKLLIELDRTCKDKLGIKYDDSKV